MTTDGYIEACESLLINFPNLNGFYNSFEIRANIDKYLKSKNRPVCKLSYKYFYQQRRAV